MNLHSRHGQLGQAKEGAYQAKALQSNKDADRTVNNAQR